MQQISDLNLKILLSQRLMGLVRKKHLVGIAPNQTSPPFAEREGFEPPVPLGTPVFKTGVIDHSTIFP